MSPTGGTKANSPNIQRVQTTLQAKFNYSSECLSIYSWGSLDPIDGTDYPPREFISLIRGGLGPTGGTKAIPPNIQRVQTTLQMELNYSSECLSIYSWGSLDPIGGIDYPPGEFVSLIWGGLGPTGGTKAIPPNIHRIGTSLQAQLNYSSECLSIYSWGSS